MKLRGFFEKERTQAPFKSAKGVHSCVSCGLYRDVRSPRIKPWGNFKKKIMIIGEAPGEDEDRRGRPWQGKMGQALRGQFRELGVDLFEDCVSLNAINCRPTDKQGANRAPTNHEVACCRQKILNAVKKYDPHVILLLGGSAVESLIGYRWKGALGGITKWAGWTIPDRDFNAWICPTWHPSFVERQKDENEVRIQWKGDLRKALTKAGERLPKVVPEKESVVIVDEGDVEEILTELRDPNTYEHGLAMAFDIETTGLKPYRRDEHSIVTIAFCNRPDQAYAMKMPREGRPLQLVEDILENPVIDKIAANMKFEDTWLKVLNGINPRPWWWDTMLAAHVLDNRPGITGLKFQSYVRFGLMGYEEAVNPYLKSGNSNEPNRIHDLAGTPEGLRELLVYNGIDALMEYRLAWIQMEEMGYED